MTEFSDYKKFVHVLKFCDRKKECDHLTKESTMALGHLLPPPPPPPTKNKKKKKNDDDVVNIKRQMRFIKFYSQNKKITI